MLKMLIISLNDLYHTFVGVIMEFGNCDFKSVFLITTGFSMLIYDSQGIHLAHC